MIKQQRPERIELTLDQIRPYWRNPRLIGDDTVAAVAESIRQYGYPQPIVVDQDNVIIIGHARYLALRRALADTESVDVLQVGYLSPAEVKELRLVDNRAAEYTEWDFDKLAEELEQHATIDYMHAFFPEAIRPTEDLVENHPAPAPASDDPYQVPLICPACFHGWSVDAKDYVTAPREDTDHETA